MAHIPGMKGKGFLVQCDKCKGNFKLSHSNLQTHRATAQELMDNHINIEPGEKYYKMHYYCKHCKHEYIVCFISQFLKSDLGPRIKEAKKLGQYEKEALFARMYKKELDHINNR